ncbi:hypothetical protein K503DRAFT_804060 [Rhizopogon vinicolor AM-OR11-026]|uniref:WD40 repeat-like protein n=1 Tax=Rhizopogon vinicolor AM-OR11-026 TaxID=1314800 RepID=A0A1B7MMJ7_9AGAM|nr:hypothetical protein K503DRAFT_804060 [Rhizopogon vinicolor AM-OR11-026]
MSQFPAKPTMEEGSAPQIQFKRPTAKYKLEGHDKVIWSFVFLYDNVHVVSGLWDGTMHKWNGLSPYQRLLAPAPSDSSQKRRLQNIFILSVLRAAVNESVGIQEPLKRRFRGLSNSLVPASSYSTPTECMPEGKVGGEEHGKDSSANITPSAAEESNDKGKQREELLADPDTPPLDGPSLPPQSSTALILASRTSEDILPSPDVVEANPDSVSDARLSP